MRTEKEIFYLDIVRLYAVLLVVLAHFLVYTGHTEILGRDIFLFGRLGVGLFFVHTFLVLCWSLERIERQQNFKKAFIIRRVFRIFPLPILVFAIMLLFKLPTGHLSYSDSFTFELHEMNALKYASNLLLLSNFLENGHLFEMMWSICMEFQAYLVLPLIWCASKARSKYTCLAFLSCLFAVSYIVQPIADLTNARMQIFKIPAYLTWMPVLYSGVVSYRFFKDATPKIPLITLPIWLLLITFIHFLSYEIFWTSILAGSVAILLPWLKDLKNIFAKQALPILVRYTYGVFAFQFIGLWLCVDPKSNSSLWVQFIYLVLFLFFVSVLTYHLLEQPLMNLGKRLSAKLA